MSSTSYFYYNTHHRQKLKISDFFFSGKWVDVKACIPMHKDHKIARANNFAQNKQMNMMGKFTVIDSINVQIRSKYSHFLILSVS